MGLQRQPTAFFGGGRVIKGDIELSGDLLQDPIRIGLNAQTLSDTMAIGINADATGTKSIAIGRDSIANNQNNTALGREAEATGGDATALGNETTAPSDWNTVIGYDAGADEETVGLEPNGKNIVLVGRKAQASGDNGVAIGEISRANGNNSTAVGRGTQAFADNSSVFGQGSTVDGSGATVVGQNVTVTENNATSIGTDVTVSAPGATGIGRGAVATAENATAVGNGAEANGLNSLAIGNGVVVDQDNSYSFGDRNVILPLGRSFLYPEDAGSQTIANIPVTDSPAAGTAQEYKFEVGGESIFEVAAEADGSGGIQNKVARIKGSFDIRGDGDDLPDIISGDISIVDDSGTEQIGLDATSDPIVIDFNDNRVNNFGLRNGESVTYIDDAGSQRLADINVDAAAENAEESISIGINQNNILKAYGQSDGVGGVKNLQLRFIEEANVNGNDIRDGANTIWDSVNTEVPNSAMATILNNTLNNSTINVTAGNGLDGPSATDISLGGSFTFDISTDGIQLDEIDQSIAPTWTSQHEFQSGLDLSNSATTINMGEVSSIINLPSPGSALEAANKGYVDGVAEGLNIKQSSHAASTQNIDLTTSGLPSGDGTIDGVTIETDDIVLLKDQTDDADNGLYDVGASPTDPSSWARADDFNEASEATSGSLSFVREGTNNGSISFVTISSDVTTLGTDPIIWDEFSRAGEFIGGVGINKDNLTFSVDITQLSGFGIEKSGDTFRIASEIAGSGISGGSGSALSLTNDTVTIAGNAVSLGGSIDIDLADLSSFNTSGNDLVDGASTIWDSAAGYVPSNALQSDTVTVSTGTGISGGGDFNLGGSGISISLTNTDITINSSNGITGGTVSLGGSVDVGISGALELDTDLQSSSGGTGVTIWDESSGYIPQGRLQNDSVTVSPGNGLNATNSGLVSLGNSTTVGIANNAIQLDEIDESISPTWTGDHVFNGSVTLGTLSIASDPGNAVLANAEVTSGPSAGTEQSYSFDINSSSILTVFSEADGAGGTQNEEVQVNGDIKATGELTEGAAL